MESVGTVIVGAGVIGLAVAKRLAESGREVLVIERAGAIGEGTSSRNSEVIHAGIYYEPGSAKARLCVAGRRLLYPYAAERGVAARRIGKLIVATREEDRARLRDLRELARRNGLTAEDEALQLISRDQARAMEPQLECVEALWSPSTGIVDSHALMLALQGDAENAGASLVLQTAVQRITRSDGGFIVETHGDDGHRYEFACKELINSAGLHAQEVAARMKGVDPSQWPEAQWVKGSYFTLAGVRPPFSHLVYPIPASLGLGVHVTLDLGGQLRFGPDTEPVSAIDYRVDARRADVFYDEVRKYWPGLPDGALQPGYSGIRPKLKKQPGDFTLLGPRQHGIAGLVQLFGMESPGLTSCLAVADDVFGLLTAA
jgi:L-2-hydroxyglutarate oxidase LhgO